MSWLLTRTFGICIGAGANLKRCAVSQRKHFHKHDGFETTKIDRQGAIGNVGVIYLKSQDGYNYLGKNVLKEIYDILEIFKEEEVIKAVVVTGTERVFSAGASIMELNNEDDQRHYAEEFEAFAKTFTEYRKPVIAAVNGFALGGGCELAMLCDITYAGKNAKFGLPETLIGTIPGCGGTQRLPRAIGKSRAMEVCLSGKRLSATEARQLGLVSKVFETKRCLEEAVKLGDRISKNSSLANYLCKIAINNSYDMGLSNGSCYARRIFHGTFA